MPTVIASRYARALADAVGAGGDYSATLKELEDFVGAWRESSELREVLVSPAVSPEQKRKILDAILGRLGTSVTTSNFLRVLLSHYRIELLEDVVQAFGKVVNARLGVIEVQISYAHGLSSEEQDALRSRFQELTGKKVEMEFRRDDSLLGGVQARIGSTIYDGSVSGQLERLRARLEAS